MNRRRAHLIERLKGFASGTLRHLILETIEEIEDMDRKLRTIEAVAKEVE